MPSVWKALFSAESKVVLFDNLRSKDRSWGKWFRLGQWQLTVSETSLIRAYFRLYAQNPEFRWNFVEKPPFDALLIDESVADIDEVLAKLRPRASILITKEQRSDSLPFLKRPLRSDSLEKWLRRIEYEISRQESSSERPVLTSAMLSTQASDMALPISPRANISADAQKRVNASTEYFKLRRWPPVMLLQRNPVRTRLATMLLRRAMRLEEMASVTQISLHECASFINLLRNSGLIEVYTKAVPPSPPNELSLEEGKGDLLKGFVAMFRRKLKL